MPVPESPFSALFEEYRLLERLVHGLHTALAPQVIPSSKDMPVEGGHIQERPGVVACKLHRVAQQVGNDFDL